MVVGKICAREGVKERKVWRMIKTVFFDLDDTLFDFHASEHTAILDTFRHVGIEPSEETAALYSRINLSCWERLERGEWTRDEVLVRRFDLLFDALGVAGDAMATQKYYEERLSHEVCYIDGARELLEGMRGKYRLYITSNGTAIVQDRRIASSGISEYFDGIFISERVGAHKPSAEFFDRIFDTVGGERGETVIIGDSLTSDIRGGLNAGIHTVHYNPQGRVNDTGILPEYEVRELCEIPALIERI